MAARRLASPPQAWSRKAARSAGADNFRASRKIDLSLVMLDSDSSLIPSLLIQAQDAGKVRNLFFYGDQRTQRTQKGSPHPALSAWREVSV